MEPELATISLIGGPFCGRELRIESADVETIGLLWEGATALYRFDPADGDYYHVPPSQAPADTGDRIYSAIVNAVGEATFIELMALVAVKEMCKGNIEFWRAMAERVDRLRGISS
jgi:hypothetical protein